MQSLMKNTRAYQLLEAEAKARSLAHAYALLLDDPRNLRDGLKTFAKVFFNCHQEVLSEQKQRIARLIDEENFSDCIFYPEAGKKFVVEDAERLAEECLLQPVEGEKKLFVVSDFALSTPQAQNKLLKLLEEPPESVCFLLGATTSFSVLPTVLSRVKQLEVQPFSSEEILLTLSRIYGNKFAKEEYALCAAASGGYLGNAQNMLEGGAYKTLSNDAFTLALTPKHQLPVAVKQTGDTKNKKELLSLLRIIFRDATLLKTAEEKSLPLKNAVFLRTEGLNLARVAKKYSLRALIYAQTALSEAEQEVAFNAYFPQCVELLMAKILRENNE